MTREGPLSLSSSARALAAAAVALLERPDSARGPQRIRRLEQAVAPVDLLGWLEGHPSSVRWFWADRENAFATAGIGMAWRAAVESAEAIAPLLTQIDEIFRDAGVRMYGGLRFDAAREVSELWRGFGVAQFLVPRVELREDNGRCAIACHLDLPADAQRPGAPQAIMAEILAAGEPGEFASNFDPTVVRRVDQPESAGWAAAVHTCLDAFAREAAEKIVLARQTDFFMAEPIAPMGLLRALLRGTPNSYHYCFQPEPGIAFVGASPERLYRRDGRSLETEALAGTRARGATPAEDERLGQELLESDKEQREHAHVSRTIRAVLRGLCERVEDGAPRISRLGHVQHLLTPIHGTLRARASDADLVQGLHPTPAVGGVPRGEALAAIRALEPFDRGWYTGPIGWIGRDAAEFSVAIRSAIVHGDCVSVFTGNGIVPGSDADEEWQELETKLADFRGVLEGAAAATGSGRA